MFMTWHTIKLQHDLNNGKIGIVVNIYIFKFKTEKTTKPLKLN